VIIEEQDNELMHYGILRRSGRYPWGSGRDEHTRNRDFLSYLKEMESQGLTQSEIARGISDLADQKFTVNDLRAARSIAVNEQRAANIAMAHRLWAKSMSKTAIAERMGVSESVVRNWLKQSEQDRSDILTTTANRLKERCDEVGFVDVGVGVERHLGVTRTRLDTALGILKEKGYEVHTVPLPTSSGNEIKLKVLGPPKSTQRDAFLARENIQQIKDFSSDNGRSYAKIHPPLEIDPKRVKVVPKEEGGDQADGMIYVRPGVKDVEIGGARYAQVRVAVGPNHYLKGMAVYKDNLPSGVDIEFHTSKPRADNPMDLMKKNADEKGYVKGGDHPLLKSIDHQIVEGVGTKQERVTSAMNIVNEEGDWTKWSRNLSSQMLSKQSPLLVKTQLAMTQERRAEELKQISALTNPVVKKKLLEKFAESADAASVHLKAAALPRVASHVILPVASMPKNQIFAPQYKDGERVVLIRHPHGGTFEIPELVVNNKHPESIKLMGKNAPDAIGIHPSVASWLSGADFDGDTVLVIPNNNDKVRHSRPLDALKDFDPRASYPGYEGMKRMKNTQAEMGNISNLITDMSLQNASQSDIARAVRHSMVVIDAEKHNLNWKQSAKDNGIQQLKEKYQGGRGATTIVSRAKSPVRIPERKPRTQGFGGPIDTKTGALAFEPTNRTKSDGTLIEKPFKALELARDARTLMSTKTGTPIERLYADHSNKLKGLADKARLEAYHTKPPRASSSAAKTYHKEVTSLNAKLEVALRNAPLERQAQIISNTMVKIRLQADPTLSREEKKKVRYKSITRARNRVGAKKIQIDISPEEWNAIQAGAISPSKLTKILDNSDLNVVKELATPRTLLKMTATKTSRAKQMLESGYTRAEVAQHLGVSLSTLDLATNGG